MPTAAPLLACRPPRPRTVTRLHPPDAVGADLERRVARFSHLLDAYDPALQPRNEDLRDDDRRRRRYR